MRPRGHSTRRAARYAASAALLAALTCAGCSGDRSGSTASPADSPSGASATVSGTGSPRPSAPPGDPSYAVTPPGRLTGTLYSADVLLTSADPLPRQLVRAVRAIPGVTAVLPMSVASASVDGRALTVAAVDLDRFRRYTPDVTARAASVWRRVAGGEVALDDRVSRRVVDEQDSVRLGTAEDAPRVHVGAYAPLVPRIQAVVNPLRGDQLGIPEGNALLVSTGRFTPSALAGRLREAVDGRATIQTLALEFDLGATQTAVLTGDSVAAAVGSFTYTNLAGGRISPDPAWVRDYIRTESVPILGTVTCNKAFLPQLRGALQEIVDLGLADRIHPGEYAGCYYPRYIGRNPANGLSLHSWGIAVDLNVPGNLRGTVGEIDRGVVEVFKRWGMAWGGDWSYTDPMHFEMNAVVRAVGAAG